MLTFSKHFLAAPRIYEDKRKDKDGTEDSYEEDTVKKSTRKCRWEKTTQIFKKKIGRISTELKKIRTEIRKES